jgi:NAD-dependent dihydropyrimidine dehydrogenase PreA subunit
MDGWRLALVWVDGARCTGCGLCMESCPVGALALLDGMARVDEEACTGCGACIDVCPEGAIAPVAQGELVPAPGRPVPAVYRPGPLVQGAGAALAVAGAGLLAKAGGALRAVSRWLARQPAAPRLAVGRRSSAETPARAGRRARQRRRGR